MRHLLAILFTVLFAFPAYAFDACSPDARQHYTPIVGHYGRRIAFKIEKCGVSPSVLVGTFHSDDPKYYNSLPAAREMLKTASVAAFEYLSPPDAQQLTERYMYLPDKKELATLIGEAKYKTLLAMLHKRFPVFDDTIVKNMQPWAAAVILEFPQPKFDGVVLDDRLKRLADTSHVPLNGLETMESQLKVFSDLSMEQQIKFLDDALTFDEEGQRIEQDLEKSYSAHDLYNIEKLVPLAMALSTDPAFSQLLLDRLLYARNKAMVAAALPLVAKGNAFIAVGALHLPGKDGLLKYFEDAGYYIEPLE